MTTAHSSSDLKHMDSTEAQSDWRAPSEATETRTRAIVAIIAAAVSVSLVLVFRLVFGQHTSDFEQLVVGARRVVAGETPYTLSPLPGLEWPIFYPMPAIVFGIPFTHLPPTVVQSIFC